MNILLLANHLNAGGISRYIVNLAKGLKARGNAVWVAASGGEWVNELSGQGISFIPIPMTTKFLLSPKILRSFFILRAVARVDQIEVVHSNTRVTQFLGFLLFCRLKIPYVSAFHGFYRPKISRSLFKLAGLKTIAVSQAVKRHLVSDLEVAPENIEVISNGIEVDKILPGVDKRGSWNFNSKDILIGILGRISAEKGHFLAVEALQDLSERYERLFLLLCGEGKVKQLLIERIEQRGLKERVRFLNCASQDFLASIDILLVPSQKEGFGFSIIEAFARGIAVVGHNTGGIAEIIKNRKNGILFDDYTSLALADAIEELIIKKELRERIVAQAKEDVYNFTIEEMARKTEGIYRKALELKKR
jgi:L-malate glycosyltransferase